MFIHFPDIFLWVFQDFYMICPWLSSSFVPLRRFEIHSVEPPVGSEEGGARVTVRGVGFGNKQLTPQVGLGVRRWPGVPQELDGLPSGYVKIAIENGHL